MTSLSLLAGRTIKKADTLPFSVTGHCKGGVPRETV